MKRLSVTNYSWENNLPTFRLQMFQAKVKRCEQLLLFIYMHYWGYTSLEVKGRCWLLLPPCFLITAVHQPGNSSPPSRLKRSSESVIWMCRASFTINSSCPLPYGPALWSLPSGLDGDSCTHALLQLTSPSSLSRRHPGTPSVSSPVSVRSPQCGPGRSFRGYNIPHWIGYQKVIYPWPWSTLSRESTQT